MTWTGSGHVFLAYINEHLLIGAEQIMEKFRVIPSDSIFGCSHFALPTSFMQRDFCLEGHQGRPLVSAKISIRL